MTQLFDTETYEDTVEGESPTEDRHLRSMPTGNELGDNAIQWRLDDKTIEVGRKGIEAARRALQEAARADTQTKPLRKAA